MVEHLAHEGGAWLRAVRLSVLIAAYKSPGRSINDSTLHTVLTGQERFAITRAVMVAEMRGLADAGLAYLDEASHGLVLTLATAGEDIVLGRTIHSSIAPPSVETSRRLLAYRAMAAAVELGRLTGGSHGAS